MVMSISPSLFKDLSMLNGPVGKDNLLGSCCSVKSVVFFSLPLLSSESAIFCNAPSSIRLFLFFVLCSGLHESSCIMFLAGF